MSPSRRDAYAHCGAAGRQAIDRLVLRPNTGALHWRVFAAVLREVTLWSRLTDRRSVRELTCVAYGCDKVTGWQRDRVTRCLRELAADGVVVYVPGVGQLALAVIGLPDVEDPDALTLPFDDPQHSASAPGSEHEHSASAPGSRSGTRTAIARNTRSHRAEPGATGGHNEDVHEDVHEKKHAPAARTRASTPARRRREPDRLFDAVVACWGLDPTELTRNERGKVNAAVKQLREVDADPAEVPRRRAVYRQLYRDAADTPLALVGHWSECATLDDHAPARMSPDAVSVARAAVDLERERQRRR